LAQRFRRGNFSASLAVTRTAAPVLRVNRAALSQLMALIDELTGEVEAAPPRLDGLLALRGVVETVEDEDEAVIEARRGEVVHSWAVALDRLMASRLEEGARIALLLQSQLDEMAGLAAAAADCAAAQPAAIRQRLLAVLANLAGAGAPAMPEERVAQEIALLAARADIREEIERLRAHVEQARELLAGGETVGRRLDFLCQELNREANTLCSKSADIELTRIGLALKAVIEQFREQVQNIE
jgi:uncharacterized protein (TIGR00255 family)